ncbi:MAG: hypothetical protein C0469_00390 [Cyanobacteria bacterium DS2.3.42]|nr:hypothetical protein [Cyanobacteria bacterium DS2.3.42]
MLLVLLAMFYGTPRLVCFCYERTASIFQSMGCCSGETPQLEGDCCSGDASTKDFVAIGNRADDAPGTFMGKKKACCGMSGHAPLIVAGDLQCNWDHVQIKVVNTAAFIAMWGFTPREHVARINRAPPRLVGMGTSKTYLFKRVFLI